MAELPGAAVGDLENLVGHERRRHRGRQDGGEQRGEAVLPAIGTTAATAVLMRRAMAVSMMPGSTIATRMSNCFDLLRQRLAQGLERELRCGIRREGRSWRCARQTEAMLMMQPLRR